MLSSTDICELRVGRLLADDTGNVFILDHTEYGRTASRPFKKNSMRSLTYPPIQPSRTAMWQAQEAEFRSGH